MRDYLRLLGVFFRISFQDDAAYRGEFWMRLLATLYALAAAVVGLWILFSNTDAIAGWNIYEVLILIGTFHVVGGVIRAVFAPNFQRITEEVREGTLDFVLTKPANSQFLASFRRIAAAAGLESVMGLLIIGYGISQLPEGSSLYTAFAFAFALSCGLAVLYSFWLVLITFVFWFVRIENVTQIFWALFDAGRYPLDIYPGWLRIVVTFIVPVAAITTFPAQGLAGRLSPGSLVVYALLAALSLYASSRFWQYGVRHYTSASS
jgi:ABC-type uncharacterized transport system, permease component